MKGIRIVFLLFFIVLVSISSVKAEVHPPHPETAKAAGAQEIGDDIPVPNPIATPIDGNILFLLGAGLVLGLTAVYKNKIKKASM